MNGDSAKNVARAARTSTPLRALARLGFATTGLLHILIGGLAIGVANGAGSGSADQSGALGQLASTPGGLLLLWTVVIGLFALGLWLVVAAFLIQGGDSKRKWSHRGVEVSKAVVYIALAFTAFTFARGSSTSSASSTSQASATLMSSPGGVVVLFAGGIVVLAIGAYFAYKGMARKFTSDISVPPGPAGKVVIALGIAGYVSKGIALGVVAVLLVVAALNRDPSKSTGLDGALKTLAELPSGAVILGAVGIGLIAYGLYCFVRALRARL
jgi:hypothetical protein